MRGVRLYPDGSGISTGASAGGPAGVAYVAIIDNIVIEGALELPSATNQQAELLAAAFGLEEIDPCPLVSVFSDSQYVVKGMNEWLPNWISRGEKWGTGEWLTATLSPVKNQDHWRRLVAAVGRHDLVRFEWIKGHAGHTWNERADELAVAARHRADLVEVWVH